MLHVWVMYSTYTAQTDPSDRYPPLGIRKYLGDPGFIVHKMVVISPPPVAPLKNQLGIHTTMINYP